MFCRRRAPLNRGAATASSILCHHPRQSRESGFVLRPKKSRIQSRPPQRLDWRTQSDKADSTYRFLVLVAIG
jgi:hypothetical protein